MNTISLFIWKKIWQVRSLFSGGIKVGETFPAMNLKDTNGKIHRLTDIFPQKSAILWLTNFCEDCQSKIPLLKEVLDQAGDSFGIYAVSILEDESLPRSMAPKCPFPVLLDPTDWVGNVLGLAHPQGACPMNNLFILDNKGKVIFRHHLSAIKPEAFRKQINAPFLEAQRPK